jgi:hypothetical protein
MINVGSPGTWSYLSHLNVTNGPPCISACLLRNGQLDPALAWVSFKEIIKKSPKILLVPHTDLMQSSSILILELASWSVRSKNAKAK